TINSLEDYYMHSMELLGDPANRAQLFNVKNRPIYTKVRNSAPTKYNASSNVKNSLIADGCVIEGTVENSILFRGVKVGKGTTVKDSILFQDTVTGENVFLNCVIADKNVVIRDGRMLSGHETMPFFIDKGKMI
ncbi:MAG: glucose-1-phosphate adenylyltransferase subunit GlgD, partial [Clostridia bacterium]|nr:glucose-1-phosphate adenylyltransferase subunit GlgD [Clostridia bacterium]